MKKAQVIGFSVALAAAVGAFFFASSMIKPPPAPIVVETKVNTTEVLVANTDISVGQIVNEGNVRWVAWPTEVAARGFITKQSGGQGVLRDISGSIARSAIIAGEPINRQKLIKAGQGGVLAAILPAGMRAVSTKISAVSAAGSLILPNDHVDVILIRELSTKGAQQHVSDTLFRNVRVIAIGQQIETKEGKKSADGDAKTATLELTPRQAEMMALANKMGEIVLTLRSVADMNSEAARQGEMDLTKREQSNAVKVMRYGAKSRVYGVN